MGSACAEWIKTLPTALVALAVASVSFCQYFLAKAKFKLDLFDKRMNVFNTVWQGCSFAITLSQKKDDEAEWEKIDEALLDARFLFGKDILEYIEELQTKWSVLAAVYRNRKNEPDKEWSAEDRETERRVMHWLLAQGSGGLHQRFSKYLSFEDWH